MVTKKSSRKKSTKKHSKKSARKRFSKVELGPSTKSKVSKGYRFDEEEEAPKRNSYLDSRSYRYGDDGKVKKKNKYLENSHEFFVGMINEKERLAATLQYFFPIGLVWYLSDGKVKSSKLVKFHLKQSLVLVALYALWRIICEILWRIVGSFGWVVNTALVVLAVVGVINAHKGKLEEVPVVGKLSKHLKF